MSYNGPPFSTAAKLKILADLDRAIAEVPVKTTKTALARFYRTKFGSLVERQVGPDAKGWMTVRRLSDDAVREWNAADMAPVSAAEELEILRTEQHAKAGA